MPDRTTGDDHADLDRWLAGRHTELISDLAAALDLDAGLRDATLPARHTGLVTDLGQVLDLDAGLAAVLPAPDTPAAAPHPPFSNEPAPNSEPALSDRDLAYLVDRILAGLTNLSDEHRLAIRNEHWLDYFDACLAALACIHEIRSASDLGQSPDRARTLTLTLTLTLDSVRAFARAFDRDRARVRALDRALALALDRVRVRVHFLDLDLVRALTIDGDSALDRALDLVRALVHDLVRALAFALDHTRDDVRILAQARDLASSLSTADSERATQFDRTRLTQARIRLDAVRHDYVGVDLREVDLTRLDLSGVRWSDATRWPPEWEERIRAGSVRLGDGRYEFRPGGGTHHSSVPAYT